MRVMTADKTAKRVDSVIRWLERVKKSYSSGAKETALMDAECARADLEDLTLRMFGEFSVQGKLRGRNCFFVELAVVARAVFLSLIVVLMTVTPLSREALNVKRYVEAVEAVEAVKPEAKAEAEAVPVERKAAVIPVSPAESRPNPSQTTAQRVRKTASKPVPVQPKKTGITTDPPKPVRKTVAYDRVFSLVETGQRALRENRTVIKRK